MNFNILNIMSEPSLITLIISIIVFILTSLLKIPFKALTAKKKEEQRKALNSIIITFPLILAFIFTSLYYGIIHSVWISLDNTKIVLNIWLSALSIYEIVKRVKLIINGLGTNSDNTLDIQQAKQEIKCLVKDLKLDEKKLKTIESKISNLIKTNTLINKTDLLSIFENNIKLANLNAEKNDLEHKINETKNSLNEKL